MDFVFYPFNMVLNQFKIGVKEADFGLWVINVMFEGQLVYPAEAFPSNYMSPVETDFW